MSRKVIGAWALVGGVLIPAATHANVSSTIESINALSDRAGYQVNDVILTSELQRRVQSNAAVQQAYYALLSELTDSDNDNTQEAMAMRTTLSGYTAPTGGGFVPSGSLAPKVDGYGMPLGYCAWDHGTTNASADRISGSSVVSNSDISFAVLSSGVDRNFSTSCADVAAGAVQGDDLVTLVTVGQGNYGVATNQHFGKPVATRADLAGLDTTSTEPGEMRMVLDTGMAYAWLDLDSDGVHQWEAVSSYFYSGDSNGLAAGGEYTTSPYSVGIGNKFVDRSVTPQATLEVDGATRIVTGNGLVDTDGGAQLHVGSQEAPAGTAGEVARMAIQPYGYTGGPFNIVARDEGGAAHLDVRYGGVTSGDSIMSIASNGYVGIGTPAPQQKLDVGGNIRIGGSSAENYIQFRGTSGDDQTLGTHGYIGERIYQPSTELSELLIYKGNDIPVSGGGADRIRLFSGEIRFDTYTVATNRGTFSEVGASTSAVSRMVIKNNGDVGIGVTDPTASLELMSTAGNAYKISHGSERPYGILTKVGLRDPLANIFTQGLFYNDLENAAIHYYRGSSSTGGWMTFTTNDGSERMRLDASGRLGIGNVSPQKGLHVSNSSVFDGEIGNSPAIRGVHVGVSSAQDPQIQLTGDASGARPHIDFSGSLGVDYDARIILDSSDVLSITNTNLTVGAAPHDSLSKMQVDGVITSMTDNVGEGGQIRLAKESGYTQHWFMDNYRDSMRFFNGLNPDSTLGSVRMQIDGVTGNVGIGTTAPVAALQLGQSQMTGSPAATIEEHKMRFATQTHTGAGFDIWQRDEPSGAFLDVYYSGQNRHHMTMTSDGWTGFSTKAPRAPFDVYSEAIIGRANVDGTLDSEGAIQAASPLAGQGFVATPWVYARAIEGDQRGGTPTLITLGSQNGYTANDEIGFITQGERRAHINSDGRFTIDAASSSYTAGALTIRTPTGYATFGSNNTGWFHMNTNTDNGFYFHRPAHANGGFYTYSDIKLKKNIKEISSALESVRKIRGVTYDWRVDEFPERNLSQDVQYGVIAQELKSVFPGMTLDDGQGFLSVQYDEIIPVLIQATKELDDKNQQQDEMIESNSTRLIEHEEDIAEIRKVVMEILEGGGDSGGFRPDLGAEEKEASKNPEDAERDAIKSYTSPMSLFYDN